MNNPSVTAVVVTFNRLSQLQDTVAALCAADAQVLSHIVVFDNASTDQTGKWLAAHPDPRVICVSSEVNIGGAGGFEAAMRYGATLDTDWMVLMDDDARPAVHTLAAFHKIDRTTRDAWAAAVYDPNGNISDMNRPWVNPLNTLSAFARTVWKGRDGFHLGAAAYSGGIRDIDGGSFVGLFLSRAAIAMAGFPDGRLFLYGEDVLYTLALSAKGGRIAFDPTLKFEHDCETLNSDATMTPLWKVYYFYRNKILAYRVVAGGMMVRPILAVQRRNWRRRARAYGADGASYIALLDLAISDGLAGHLDRPHGKILALSGAK